MARITSLEGQTHITVSTHTYNGSAWIARITGVGGQFGFERQFLHKHDVTTARTNKYRDLEWDIDMAEGAVYEYRGLDASSSGGADGFWTVSNSRLLAITRLEARAILQTKETVNA